MNNKEEDLALFQKKWIKKLTEVVPENSDSVKDLKLAKDINSDGAKDYWNFSNSTEIWKLADHRSILDNEAVIEFDSGDKKKNYEDFRKIIKFLNKEKIPYIIGNHNGRSPHVHIFFGVNPEVLTGNIDYKILRGILYQWICTKAGVPYEKGKAEIKWNPLSYDENGELRGGHLIRAFGGRYIKNTPTTYKTAVDHIPDSEDEDEGVTDPEKIRFPDRIELWKVTNKQFEDIKKTIWLHREEQEIERVELTPEITKPLSRDDLVRILGKTIKQDETNKLITFYAMLLTYTGNSQVNVSFRAPSSTGKSYIPLEIAEFFPQDDLMRLGYSSPTAFFHDTGEWDDELNGYRVDLERKIIIFMDQPHDQLLQRLRPLLSHDKKEILCKITDKKERKGLRTKNVTIRGFPSVVFCTGSLKIDEQEATRNFVLSPETNQEKIREAIILKAFKKSDPDGFSDMLKGDTERENLRKRILAIRQEKVPHIIIRNYDEISQRFLRENKHLKPRHARDIERLISLIQANALLSLWDRERDENGNVIANEVDIELGFKLWNEVSESQELGLVPYIHRLFKEVIEPLSQERNSEGLARKEIIVKHYEVYGRPLADWLLRREILPALESCGLVHLETDPVDKRKTLVYTPPLSSLFLNENNRETQGGVGSLEEKHPDGSPPEPRLRADKDRQNKKQLRWNPPSPDSSDEDLKHWIYGVRNVIAKLSDDRVIEMAVQAGWRASKIREVLDNTKNHPKIQPNQTQKSHGEVKTPIQV